MKKLLFANVLIFFFATGLFAQCENWTSNPEKDNIEESHVLYRQFVKEQNFKEAFPHWEKAYKAAPAADGKRSFHYSDGIDIYLDQFKNGTDAAAKTAATDMILKLYDQWAECYPKEANDARSNQVYNMFYVLNTPYSKTVAIIDKCIEAAGEKTSYTVIDPLARITVHQFNEGDIDAAKARDRHATMMKISDYGAENGGDYAEYYSTAKKGIVSLFTPIERSIFDCEYFKSKYIDKYKADPDNKEVYKEVYKQLKRGGCDKSDPLIYEIYLKDSIATMANFNANNPGVVANKLYKSGDFNGALAKYQEAASAESNSADKAGYYFSMASINFRKLKKYSEARRLAREAASLRPDWGKPYMLIGDMYASTSGSCGSTPFDKGLAAIAAIDKYRKAKSVDPSFAGEADKKIAKYRAYRPDQESAFMMGVKAGQSKKVPCWIGETVSVSFK